MVNQLFSWKSERLLICRRKSVKSGDTQQFCFLRASLVCKIYIISWNFKCSEMTKKSEDFFLFFSSFLLYFPLIFFLKVNLTLVTVVLRIFLLLEICFYWYVTIVYYRQKLNTSYLLDMNRLFRLTASENKKFLVVLMDLLLEGACLFKRIF